MTQPVAWVFGGGLLGQGFAVPCLAAYAVWVIDQRPVDSPILVRYRSEERRSVELQVPVRTLVFPETPPEEPALIVTAVGRNLSQVGAVLERALSRPTVPILTLENDPLAAKRLQHFFGLNAFSGVAWVTIPDPLQEEGEGVVYGAPGTLYYPRRLEKLLPAPLGRAGYAVASAYGDHRLIWSCKYHLHLAPHALLAYLGIARGHAYIHEVAASLGEDLRRATKPLLQDLMLMWKDYDLHFYEAWTRELERFARPRPPDSVWRVGRNPATKAAPGERLYRGYLAALRFGGAQDQRLWAEAYATALSLAGYALEEVTWLPRRELLAPFYAPREPPPWWREYRHGA